MRSEDDPLMKVILSKDYHKNAISWMRGCGIQKNDADDLYQDFSVRVMTRCKDYDPSKPSKTESYLNAILYHIMIDRHRKEKRNRKTMDAESILDDGNFFNYWESRVDGPSEAMERRERGEIINYVLGNLSGVCSMALRRVYFGGMSDKEIAEIEGIPRVTVRTRICAGKKMFREIVRRRNLELELSA